LTTPSGELDVFALPSFKKRKVDLSNDDDQSKTDATAVTDGQETQHPQEIPPKRRLRLNKKFIQNQVEKDTAKLKALKAEVDDKGKK